MVIEITARPSFWRFPRADVLPAAAAAAAQPVIVCIGEQVRLAQALSSSAPLWHESWSQTGRYDDPKTAAAQQNGASVREMLALSAGCGKRLDRRRLFNCHVTSPPCLFRAALACS